MKKHDLPRRFAGTALLLAPILIQIPFALLATSFDYPKILRESPDIVLRRYAAAAPTVTAVWYGYAMMILPLMAGIALLPKYAKVPRRRLLEVATSFGLLSAVVQMAGLLRWVFLVPALAKGFVDPTTGAAGRMAIVQVFQAQHQLFGVLLGEHLGQLLLAAWTAGVTLSLASDSIPQKVQRGLGLLAAGLFVAGLGDSLATAFPLFNFLAPVPAIAFLAWSVWCSLLGWLVIRNRTGSFQTTPVRLRRYAQPAAEVAVQNARL